MDDILTRHERRVNKMAMLCLFIGIAILSHFAFGCGFNRYWSYSPLDEVQKDIIPCWIINVHVDHTLRGQPDSLGRFLLIVEGKSKCKPVEEYIRVDSVGMEAIGALKYGRDTTRYSFRESDTETLNTHLFVIHHMQPFDMLPQKKLCSKNDFF